MSPYEVAVRLMELDKEKQEETECPLCGGEVCVCEQQGER